MKRGPKPQPTALKVLRGNPGQRRLNLHEPRHAELSPEVPDELVNEAARREWQRLAPSLIEQRAVTAADRATFLGYCHKYGQWLALEHEAARHPFVVRTPGGCPVPNPALCLANKAFGLVLRAASELGLTPSSRTRVVAPPLAGTVPPTSKWAGEFLK